MAYKVRTLKTAERQLEHLDRPICIRIVTFLEDLEAMDDPRAIGKALQGGDKLWRYRVGDYRLICQIEDKTITITVIKIGHRKTIYR